MRNKEAYQKLFRAKDELFEVLENILSEELRKGKGSDKLNRLIEYVETAADHTQAALAMIADENETAADAWAEEIIAKGA